MLTKCLTVKGIKIMKDERMIHNYILILCKILRMKAQLLKDHTTLGVPLLKAW